MKKEEYPIGKACGFVDCNADTGQLSFLLETAQRERNHPDGNLLIRVREGVHPRDYAQDLALYNIAVEAVECGRITHTIEAIAVGSDNFETGTRLGELVNKTATLYSHARGHREGCRLYGGSDGKTCSRIVYRQGGEYFDIE